MVSLLSSGRNKKLNNQSSNKVKEKLNFFGNSSPNPNDSGIKVAGKEGIPNPTGEGTQQPQDLKHVKQEVVEKVLEKEKDANPTPTGNGNKSAIKEGIGGGINKVQAGLIPSPNGNGHKYELRKERTVGWVAKRFHAAREDVNVTTNYSCEEIPSQTIDESSKGIETSETMTDARKAWGDEVEEMEITNALDVNDNDIEIAGNSQDLKKGDFEALVTINPSCPKIRVEDSSTSKLKQLVPSIGGDRESSKKAGNQGGSAQSPLDRKQLNGTVNASKSREIVASVDGVSVYALGKDQVEDVNIKVVHDTVGVYELQFRMMQDAVSSMEQNKMNDQLEGQTKGQFEQAIVPRTSGAVEAIPRDPGEIETLPITCASGSGSPMQIQLNVPLKSSNKILHDIITHKELPVEIQMMWWINNNNIKMKVMMSPLLGILKL
ncbi:hypothetical protein A4A49_27574 [Nicotiana attenuata]|uniref:Uncharacterized protein n=1 Tax=Nicotiana attenuata TaxID=49451 RepID=A0A314KHB8_NICAT|nr:hypothetical protein A4A49_27574 [Nicotiana attenuata]